MIRDISGSTVRPAYNRPLFGGHIVSKDTFFERRLLWPFVNNAKGLETDSSSVRRVKAKVNCHRVGSVPDAMDAVGCLANPVAEPARKNDR